MTRSNLKTHRNCKKCNQLIENKFFKQKAEGKERKSGSRRAAEEKEKEPKNGEHTIRPVALVGGVGVRLRRFCFIIIKIVVVIVYYVVEEVSLFEEYDKKREGYVRR